MSAGAYFIYIAEKDSTQLIIGMKTTVYSRIIPPNLLTLQMVPPLEHPLTESDGPIRAAALLTNDTLASFHAMPGYPDSPAAPLSGTNRVRLADAGSGKETGLFATRNFELGELIMSERPILMIPTPILDDSGENLELCRSGNILFLLEKLINEAPDETMNAFRKFDRLHVMDAEVPMGIITRYAMMTAVGIYLFVENGACPCVLVLDCESN
jgi:hypothetical protein